MLFCRNRLGLAICSLSRSLSTSTQRHFKVTILGAAGGVGQHLAFLLKYNRLVTHLALYDIVNACPGVAVDISHMNTTTSTAEGYTGPLELFYAIHGAHVIVITAGSPRQLNQTRQDFVKINSDIVFYLTWFIATHWPHAVICVFTNPLNITVPIVSDTMDIFKVYDPAKIFGITALDGIRAAHFVGRENNEDPITQIVPVIGGNEGLTIVPLLSKMDPTFHRRMPESVRDVLIREIREADDDVFEAKEGCGTATLTPALAASRFLCSVLKGLAGDCTAVDIAYVRSDCTDAKYFATPIRFGCRGMESNLGIPCNLNDYEEKMINDAVRILNKDIQTGENYVACKFDKIESVE